MANVSHRFFKSPFVNGLLMFVLIAGILFPLLPTSAAMNFNRQINYQGKLTDSSGVTVADGSYNIEFKLYTVATGGTAIWTETLTSSNRVSVTSGLFSVMLGAVTSLDNVDFNQTLYLGVNIGGSGSSASWDGEMTPRKTLGVVPAAMVAAQLQANQPSSVASTSTTTLMTLTQSGTGRIFDVFSGSNRIFTITGSAVGIGTTSPASLFSVSGDQYLNSNTITYASSSASFLTFAYNKSATSTLPNNVINAWSLATSTTITPIFSVSSANGGRIGIGTSSPSQLFSVSGNGYLTGGLGIGNSTTTAGALTISGTLDVQSTTASSTFANGINLSNGCFAVGGSCVGGSSGTVGASTAIGQVPYYAAVGATLTATSSLIIAPNGSIGIGSTTPAGLLALQASSSIPLINLLQSTSSTNGDFMDFWSGNLNGANNPNLFGSIRGLNPKVLGSLRDDTNLNASRRIYVSGRYAYVLASNRLTVVDISSTTPQVIGSVSDTSRLPSAANVGTVMVSGNYAYIPDNNHDALTIVDISNPAVPKIISYLADSADFNAPTSLYVSGKYVYVLGSTSLAAVDVSNPYAPKVVGTVTVTGTTADIWIQGKYAYIVGGSQFQTIDVSNPTNMQIAGLSTSTNFNSAQAVYVVGRYAYVVASTRLTVADIGNPLSPTVAGTITATTLLNTPYDIVVAGKYAYIAELANNRIVIADVSNPSTPLIVGDLQASTDLNGASSLAMQGRYLYVTDQSDNTFAIVDTGGLDIPAISTGSLQTNSLFAWSNADIGNDLYVRSGLTVGSAGILSNGPISLSLTSTSSLYSAFSSGITITHATGTFAGTGLLMDFATSTFNAKNAGSFTGNFIDLRVSSTTKFIVTNNGSLGIASSTPSSALSVGGNVYLDSQLITFASSSASFLTLNYTKSATSTIPNNLINAWSLATSTTITPIFSVSSANGGRIGIGTSNPAQKLDIMPNASTTYRFGPTGAANLIHDGEKSEWTIAGYGNTSLLSPILVGARYDGNSASSSVVLVDDVLLSISAFGANSTGALNTDASGRIRFEVDGPPSASTVPGRIAFMTQNDAGSIATRMTIDRDGKVGIGTTSPISMLSVQGIYGSTTPLFTVASSTNSALTNTRTFFTITSSGFIGVGTSSPGTAFSVTGNAHFDSNTITFASSSASSLQFDYQKSATSTIPNNIINAWSIATSTTVTPILSIDTTNGGRIGIGTSSPQSTLSIEGTCIDTGTGCADFAELYPSSEDVAAGDIVALDPDNARTIKKATNDTVAIGVVSSNPAITIEGSALQFMTGANYHVNPSKPAIALAGRVPVKVNDENGPINIGDRIAPSSISGVGKKANAGEQTIGIAIESLQSGNDKIMVFVNLGQASLTVSNADATSVALTDIMTHDVVFQTHKLLDIGKLTGAGNKWSIDEEGKLMVKEIETDKLKVKSGITTFDEDTGDPYCIKVKGGALQSVAGECGSASVVLPQQSSMLPETSETSTPTILDNQDSTTTPAE